ncbi:MAG: SRPBCC family protein [Planctomycetaceae bacterium]|nr:SRPBCC family protein [Planctomycetaceae bacterium]
MLQPYAPTELRDEPAPGRRRIYSNMRPLRFTCRAVLQSSATAVAEQILDLGNWTNFRGYGCLPGIRAARFEKRTPEVVGTRIAVVNTDDSTHVEEIVEWNPPHRVALRMQDFSPPLARLATHIEETWTFATSDAGTAVERSFAMFPKSWFAGVFLRLIAPMLRRAVDRHLADLRAAESSEAR